MTDTTQMLARLAGKSSPFATESRYYQIGTAQYTFADGRSVTYVKRRFSPEARRLGLLAEHRVRQGDRLDQLAHQYYGNAELFWRLCDSNNALRPDELTDEVSSRLRIALPEGVPGG